MKHKYTCHNCKVEFDAAKPLGGSSIKCPICGKAKYVTRMDWLEPGISYKTKVKKNLK